VTGYLTITQVTSLESNIPCPQFFGCVLKAFSLNHTKRKAFGLWYFMVVLINVLSVRA